MSLPRVTEILEAVGLGPDLSMVPPAVLEVARQRGQALHALAEALGYGYLDEADVTPEVAPYFDAFKSFLAESGAEHIASEFEVVHPAWAYVGHPDLLCWLNGLRVLVDLKTGDTTGADLQVAGYVHAYNAQWPAAPIVAGAVLSLRHDGTYRLTEVDLAAATQVWLAAVVVHRARKERGR